MSPVAISNVTQTSPSAREYFVLGTRVDAVQIPGVITQMQDWIARRDDCRYIAVTGMHGVTEAKHDPQLRAALASASLVVPDGMPLVWLGRRRGFTLPRRVYGPELMLRFWQETPSARYRHFLYGGAPGVADALAHKFARQFPNHQIAGTFSPPHVQPAISKCNLRGGPGNLFPHQRFEARYRLGRPRHAQARALDARPPGPS